MLTKENTRQNKLLVSSNTMILRVCMYVCVCVWVNISNACEISATSGHAIHRPCMHHPWGVFRILLYAGGNSIVSWIAPLSFTAPASSWWMILMPGCICPGGCGSELSGVGIEPLVVDALDSPPVPGCWRKAVAAVPSACPDGWGL